ncbi:MAG: peptidylprolyl isomerase [Betaproteobacteria bacterium]|nr:peptidylprolyl isomerase [Betaproteobacteria bacterium]
MVVAAGTVVSLAVQLSDLWGNLIDEPGDSVQYLHGGYDDIFPAVEAALEGKAVNDRIEVRLEPEDAYGDYDETLLRVEDRGRFPDPIEVGMRFAGDEEGETGDESELVFSVTDIEGDKVILDANHPLAGMALQFVATVVGVRPANADELKNGTADDPHSVIVRPM